LTKQCPIPLTNIHMVVVSAAGWRNLAHDAFFVGPGLPPLQPAPRDVAKANQF
jgi:hypothetical protein